MADYKELLRRAISALPENNGAARRAVYEKARSALVGQLRAISPPLPARDITQHRLQLEDCIRQVEQEASEAVIMLGREGSPAFRAFEQKPDAAKSPDAASADESAKNVSSVADGADGAPSWATKPTEPARKSTANMSIEEIIAEAAATGSTSMVQVPIASKPAGKSESAMLPKRSETPRSIPVAPISNIRPLESPSRSAVAEQRHEPAPSAANAPGEAPRNSGRVEPSLGGGSQAALRRQAEPTSSAEVEPALSSVREVDIEVVDPDASEAEGAIERAIETLDREARGEVDTDAPESAQAVAERMFAAPRDGADDGDDSGFAAAPAAARAGSGLTIFLVVFALLLVGVGGAGFWAWREGFIDLDQMFGQSQPVVAQASEPATPATPTLDPVPLAENTADPVAAPGNTATTPAAEPATTLEGLEAEERLAPALQTATGTDTVLPPIDGSEGKGEERLPGQDVSSAAVNDPGSSVDPAVLAGSQSLLLEASATGTTGAVPFSGTVEWREGVDELGLPTLIGHASIPARNLGVDVTIRKNSDPSLPASHLMEVDFQVSDTFIGGTVANLPGVLLKDRELVPGTPLVGASARVVGNSFLFALSASPEDAATNTDLLENRKWMDLAVVYGTGRNAIITLEKDDAAQAMFDKVFTAWAQ